MDTEKVIELVNHAGQSCSCSHEHHPVTIEQITVKQNAYEQLSSFLTEKKYKNLLLINLLLIARIKRHSLPQERKLSHT